MKILSSIPEITFDDVLLLPRHSAYENSQETNKINLRTRVSRRVSVDIPIASSPMPGVTETDMAIEMGTLGGIGFLHPFQNPSRQLEQLVQVKRRHVPVAVGVIDFSGTGWRHVRQLIQKGADIISLETEHADNAQTIQFLRRIKKSYPKTDVGVALVVTPEATRKLIQAGADSIRVGIGGGSHCTTRLVTGVGRPQLSAVKACADIARKHAIPLISDTGIRYPGDVAKAIAFGADAVMIGGLLAGTDESPGEIIKRRGGRYKYSWGMCTDRAINYNHYDTSFLRLVKRTVKRTLGLQTSSSKDFEEGVEGLVKYVGPVSYVVDHLIAGLRRSMWYQGVTDLPSLRTNARVVLVSLNTIQENLPRI